MIILQIHYLLHAIYVSAKCTLNKVVYKFSFICNHITHKLSWHTHLERPPNIKTLMLPQMST